MNYLEAFLLVSFGMVAGWPILLLVLATAAHKRQINQWRVVDSTCREIEDKGT